MVTVVLTSSAGADPSYTIPFQGGITDAADLETSQGFEGNPEGQVNGTTGQGIAREDTEQWTGIGPVTIKCHQRSKTELDVDVQGGDSYTVNPGQTITI
jgi:hypothetical protein